MISSIQVLFLGREANREWDKVAGVRVGGTGMSFTRSNRLESLKVKLAWCLRRNSRPSRRHISRRGPQGQPYQRQNEGGRASSQVESLGTREEQREAQGRAGGTGEVCRTFKGAR